MFYYKTTIFTNKFSTPLIIINLLTVPFIFLARRTLHFSMLQVFKKCSCIQIILSSHI
uniref:Uncharacterized protein n=1 Tax=Siphoviridae sp. cteZR38 TaxID=2827906 RepID=A0A8S5SN75_9CAUD|nr:MAG TPA: hypothetical protein [Siphoviridae sp. cteZR38]